MTAVAGSKRRQFGCWIAGAAVLLMMAAAKVLYNMPWPELAPALHQPAAFIFALLLNVSIVFGPSVIYPLGRFRGAAPRICIMACLLTPVVWNIWEIIRVTAYFSVAESLYYGLNPLFLGALAFTAAQMGFWEAVYRVRRKEPGEKAHAAGPIFIVLASLALVYVFCFWAMGQHWFYLYQAGYKALF
ncbi:MAG: hypothetical protein KGY61_11830 [Desulfobacterales bacterium]|nr:hypothetical protein [Desulfobacterales bacterium]